GLARIAGGGVDIILCDLGLTDSQGLNTLKRLQKKGPDIPIIVLSGVDDSAMETDAIHLGAQDYLVKGEVERKLIVRSIRYAIERKSAEAELQEAQKNYRSIYENTLEGIFQTTMDGRYRSANPALARIYGYDSPEELTATMTDIGTSLYAKPGRREEFVRLMRWHQVVTNFESQVYRKDGKIIWISENVRAVRNRQGEFLYYEGTVTDITERKEAELRLKDSEALYHSLVETLPQNIFRKDLMERFTFANQRFCASLGKPLEDIIGKTDFEFFTPELAQKYQNDDRKVMETGEPFETVEAYQQTGGETKGQMHYVNVVKTPLRDAEGKIIGLQGIFWDITERVEAEEREKKAVAALAVSREELRAKNEQLEKDVAMAREIQQSFFSAQYPVFPATALPQHSAIQFYHRHIPAGSVSGDFFHVTALSDTVAGIFISDVMGHGVRSALVTAMIRAMMEELRPIAADPGAFMTQVNQDLRAILKQSGTLMFATAVYLTVDLDRREYRYVCAGHPKPLLVTGQEGTVSAVDADQSSPSQPALGLFDQTTYAASSRPIVANDLLLFYTDGLIENENDAGEWYDLDRLKESVHQHAKSRRLSDLCDGILADIRTFAHTDQFDDDVCMLGVRIP
ncbi:MAG TPA: hypothetical protein DCY13_05055, partial [Verrucomicrobiales bacterium]|nr:hypothetical protein [Verrucomicrobiales bacterium]